MMISYQVETFGKPLARVLRENPTPKGTEVIIRVLSSGVCHSDVHMHDGFFDLGEGNKIDMTRALRLPRTLGHEISGTVIALGPDAKGISIGDNRVVYPWLGCDVCAVCVVGDCHLCAAPRALGVQRDGGFSDYVIVPHPDYLVDYGQLSSDQACTYACAGLTAFSALKKAGTIDPSNSLLIIGAGGVGLSAVRLAKELFGVGPVVAEIDKSKWDTALAAGAAYVIDPSSVDAPKALLSATNGGVAVAIDFVGAGLSFAFGLSVLRKAGTLVCVGLFGGTANISPVLVAMRAIHIIGSYVGSLQDFRELMTIAKDGKLPELPLSVRPLAEATNVLEDLRAGRVRGRTVLRN